MIRPSGTQWSRWSLTLAAAVIAGGLGCSSETSPVSAALPTSVGADGGDSDTGDSGAGASTDTGSGTTSDTGGGTGTGSTGDSGSTGDTGEDPPPDDPECDDGKECTAGKWDGESCTYVPKTTPECAPGVTITWPPRGMVFLVGDEVLVEGTTHSPSGQIDEFRFGGVPVPLAEDGSFSIPIEGPVHGINILKAEVKDPSGQARAVRSFMYGETFYPTADGAAADALVHDGLLAFMGQDLWDDDDLSDVDDVATFAHLILDGLDIGALIPQPLTAEGEEPAFGWCEWTVWVHEVSYDVYSIDVRTEPGGVFISGSLANLFIDFEAIAPDFGCPDAIGNATSSIVTLATFAQISLHNGKTVVEIDPGDVDVVIGELTFDIQEGAASSFDWFVNWFSETIAEEIELAIEDALVTQVGPLIEQFMGMIGEAFIASFEIPPFLGGTQAVPVTFAVAPSTLVVSEDGATLGIALSGTTPKGIDSESPGSIARAGCFQGFEPGIALPKDSHVAAAIHDDLFNQAFFAAWWGGIMNVTIDEELLSSLEVELPVEGLSVRVAPQLPPVLTSCNPKGQSRLQVGDIEVEANFMFNDAPAMVRAYVSADFAIEVDISAADNATLAFTFGVADFGGLEFQIAETTGAIEGAKNLLELLLTQVVEDVVIDGLSTQVFENLPVPAFDLNEVIPQLPVGTVLKFDPGPLIRLGGYTVIDGTVVD